MAYNVKAGKTPFLISRAYQISLSIVHCGRQRKKWRSLLFTGITFLFFLTYFCVNTLFALFLLLLRSAAILNADGVYLLMYSHTQTTSLVQTALIPIFFPVLSFSRSFLSLFSSLPGFIPIRFTFFFSSKFIFHFRLHFSLLPVFLLYFTISPLGSYSLSPSLPPP